MNPQLHSAYMDGTGSQETLNISGPLSDRAAAIMAHTLGTPFEAVTLRHIESARVNAIGSAAH